jgi:hypothetical protein
MFIGRLSPVVWPNRGFLFGCLDFNAMQEASCCRHPSMDSLAPHRAGPFVWGLTGFDLEHIPRMVEGICSRT